MRQVPDILKTYDAKTGHFGQGIWICRDQNVMFPLAVAYSRQAPGNKYYKDKQLLETIMKAGDALAADADKDGKWVFRKKDGSEWGMIRMPWTYSRWIRTFMLIRDDMPADRRAGLGESPDARLRRGQHAANWATCTISRRTTRWACTSPARRSNKPQWCEQAAEFMMKVAKTQFEGGYWSEDVGPVVRYNFVYVDALGTYYAASGDKTRPAGHREGHPLSPPVHLSRRLDRGDHRRAQPVPRRRLSRQRRFHLDACRPWLCCSSLWAKLGKEPLPVDLIACLLLRTARKGPMDSIGGRVRTIQLEVMTEKGVDRAAVLRQGPWFVCCRPTPPRSPSRAGTRIARTS